MNQKILKLRYFIYFTHNKDVVALCMRQMQFQQLLGGGRSGEEDWKWIIAVMTFKNITLYLLLKNIVWQKMPWLNLYFLVFFFFAWFRNICWFGIYFWLPASLMNLGLSAGKRFFYGSTRRKTCPCHAAHSLS